MPDHSKNSEPKSKPKQAEPSLVERSRAFVAEVRARSNPEKGLPADKAFIDSLYEDD